MVFPCSDGTLGRVASMYVWWHKLVVDVLGAVVFFECGGGFVVEPVGLWLEAAADEVAVEFLVGTEDFTARAVFEWLREDCVGVIVIEDHDVLVASTGSDWESAGLVGVDSSRFFDGGKDLVGGGIVRLLGWVHVNVRGCFGLFGFCGSDVFSCLVHVALCCGNGVGEVFLDGGCGEARPGLEKTFGDGVDPGGFAGAERGGVEELDECWDGVGGIGSVAPVFGCVGWGTL